MTQDPSAVLIEVWRTACRHAEVGDSVACVAPLVSAALSPEQLIVLRLDEQELRLDVVAGAPARGARELKAPEAAKLAEWCRTGALVQRAAEPGAGSGGEADGVSAGAPVGAPVGTQARWPLNAWLPEGLEGEVLVGPLNGGGEALGALILCWGPSRRLQPAQLELARALLEPVAVALHNDRRFVELSRLREAVEADNRALLTRLAREDISGSIVGSEAGLADVMSQVEKVAPTQAPVLILGETGSGKEVIARAIHDRSRRGEGPVVRVNCGAIPSELVDSELFGHERGSFTGAVGTRKGWFERADGGTLFLDEIGELPLAAQVRLLRILQDGSFERVGGERSLTVDVRLVAATNRDLAEMVARGEFRQDLWYRISVFPIRLPSLRERREDIALLARHFAGRAGQRLGGVPLEPTSDDLAALASYDWPGNVRELAAVIERAAILGGGRRLEIEAALGVGERAGVPGALGALVQSAPGAPGGLAAARDAGLARRETRPGAEPHDGKVASLDEAQVRHIESALASTGGRIEGAQGAAALLGINPHTLRARMRKLGIDWNRFRTG